MILCYGPRAQKHIFVENVAHSSHCEAWINMVTVTFLKNYKPLILMSKIEFFVLYLFLVRTTSNLYFHGTKVKTTLVFIFNKMTFWKLSKFAYIGCLGRAEVSQKFEKSQFWPFLDWNIKKSQWHPPWWLVLHTCTGCIFE